MGKPRTNEPKSRVCHESEKGGELLRVVPGIRDQPTDWIQVAGTLRSRRSARNGRPQPQAAPRGERIERGSGLPNHPLEGAASLLGGQKAAEDLWGRVGRSAERKQLQTSPGKVRHGGEAAHSQSVRERADRHGPAGPSAQRDL